MQFLIIAVGNIVCATVFTILMLRRVGKMLIHQHQKSFKFGREDAVEWMLEMPISDYDLMRYRHAKEKEEMLNGC